MRDGWNTENKWRLSAFTPSFEGSKIDHMAWLHRPSDDVTVQLTISSNISEQEARQLIGHMTLLAPWARKETATGDT